MFLSDHRDLATVLAAYRAVDPREARAAMDGLFLSTPPAAAAAPPPVRARKTTQTSS